jgi:hypothetical protein
MDQKEPPLQHQLLEPFAVCFTKSAAEPISRERKKHYRLWKCPSFSGGDTTPGGQALISNYYPLA